MNKKKSNKIDFGIVIPVIEEELSSFYRNIYKLIENLKFSKIFSYKIVVIIQSKNKISCNQIEKIEYYYDNFYSVSKARNIGFKKLNDICKYIYFLDHDAVPSIEFLTISKFNISLKTDVWACKLCWTDNINKVSKKIDNSSRFRSIFYSPFNAFLGCYIFKCELLNAINIKFNENLGPAEDTFLKCGEDVIFLSDFFSKNNINKYKYYSNIKTFHPKRLSDNSKTITYIEGQAVVFKYLLGNSKIDNTIRFSSLVYLILYFFNGIIKFISFEKNGFYIMSKRIMCLFKKHDYSKIF